MLYNAPIMRVNNILLFLFQVSFVLNSKVPILVPLDKNNMFKVIKKHSIMLGWKDIQIYSDLKIIGNVGNSLQFLKTLTTTH